MPQHAGGRPRHPFSPRATRRVALGLDCSVTQRFRFGVGHELCVIVRGLTPGARAKAGPPPPQKRWRSCGWRKGGYSAGALWAGDRHAQHGARVVRGGAVPAEGGGSGGGGGGGGSGGARVGVRETAAAAAAFTRARWRPRSRRRRPPLLVESWRGATVRWACPQSRQRRPEARPAPRRPPAAEPGGGVTGGSERGWVWDGVPRRRRATLVDQALAAAARLKVGDILYAALLLALVAEGNCQQIACAVRRNSSRSRHHAATCEGSRRRRTLRGRLEDRRARGGRRQVHLRHRRELGGAGGRVDRR